jgi:hypothetical protein
MSKPGNKAVDTTPKQIEERILVLAPTGKDSVMACRILDDAGLRTRACADMHEICSELKQGAGALLITDETLSIEEARIVSEKLRHAFELHVRSHDC